MLCFAALAVLHGSTVSRGWFYQDSQPPGHLKRWDYLHVGSGVASVAVSLSGVGVIHLMYLEDGRGSLD